MNWHYVKNSSLTNCTNYTYWIDKDLFSLKNYKKLLSQMNEIQKYTLLYLLYV
jgi:hypothetical protein